MARRSTSINVAAGPDWTDVFLSDDLGGDDGAGAREILITCAATSPNPLEYRREDPADPDGQSAALNPGEAFVFRFGGRVIKHIVMRGVGGAAVGGVEVVMD